MTKEERELANRLVDTLLDVPTERRAELLQTLCPHDEVVREEVRLLLNEDAAFEQRLSEFSRSAHSRSAGAAAAVRSSPGVPAVIDRYHVMSPLGEGGMGRVFLAQQRAPVERLVAVKLIRTGFDNTEVMARFDAERQSLAWMDHPGIARMLDAGITSCNQPYLVMEYVPGKPVTRFADDERLSIPERLELFDQVCRAVEYAHSKGVIHRDIKPSNVLAWTEAGTARVKVIDFGVAKVLGSANRASDLTQAGAVLGTYEYMSPEQAAGSGDIGTRSDVYALGVLLYEMITGIRPFERADIKEHAASPDVVDSELRRVIREVLPPRPSTRLARMHQADDSGPSPRASSIASCRMTEPRALMRVLQRELEWIPLKAIRKEPERRYAGAAALADDVRRYLGGRALLAGPESRWYRMRKFASRHRVGLAAILSIVLLLCAGTVGTTIGFVREAGYRAEAEENERIAQRTAYASSMTAAFAAIRESDAGRLHAAIEAAPEATRGWEWRMLSRAASGAVAELQREPHERFVESIALDDNLSAWSTTGGRGSSVRWTLSSGQIQRRESGGPIAVNARGGRLAIVRPSGALEMLDEESGALHWHAEPPSPTLAWRINRYSMSLDTTRLVAWDDASPHLTIFDCATGAAHPMPIGGKPANVSGFLRDHAAPSPLGTLTVALGDANGSWLVDLERQMLVHGVDWATSAGRQIYRTDVDFKYPFDNPYSAKVWLRDRELVVTQTPLGMVMIDAPPVKGSAIRPHQLARPARPVFVGKAPVVNIDATPDEQLIIVTSGDGGVRVAPADMSWRPGPIGLDVRNRVEPSPDGSRILALGWGVASCFESVAILPIWSRNLGPQVNKLAAWSPDSRQVVIATQPHLSDSPSDSEFFLLDAASGEQIAAWSSSAVIPDASRPRRAPEWAGNVCGITFSLDGRLLYVARTDGSLARIDTSSWSLVSEADQTEPPIDLGCTEQLGDWGRALTLSPDGAQLAHWTVVHDGSLRTSLVIRDAQSLKIVARPRLEGHVPTCFSWSPDGRALVVGFARDGSAVLQMMDRLTCSVTAEVRSPDGFAFLGASFDTSGQRLLTGTRFQSMVLDPRWMTNILEPTEDRRIISACFLPDDSLILQRPGGSFVRAETQDPEESLHRVLDCWPAGVPRPSSVWQARLWVNEASSVLESAASAPEPVSDAISRRKRLPPAVVALALELSRRCSPNINGLNSAGLTAMRGDNPSIEDLSRAARCFRAALAIKPQSTHLHDNLILALFHLGRYTECRDAIGASQGLRAAQGRPVSPELCLRLALVLRRLDDPAALDALDNASREIARQNAGAAANIRQLMELVRREFPPEPGSGEH